MHDNAKLLEKLCFFSKLFFDSWLLPRFFLMVNVQEDPRNNNSIESGQKETVK